MRASSVRPEPISPKTPSTSPPCSAKLDVLDDAGRGERLGREQHARQRLRPARRIELIDRAADHQGDHAGECRTRRFGPAADQLAVAQDGDVVGEGA